MMMVSVKRDGVAKHAAIHAIMWPPAANHSGSKAST